jgi:hypothetical protein
MSQEESTPGGNKLWIWVLLILLVTLLMVPLISMGLAFKKSQNIVIGKKSSTTDAGKSSLEEPAPPTPEMASLRATLEKAAANVIHLPRLKPKMQQVEIMTPAAAIKKASVSVHHVLDKYHQQYVEAVDQDQIRIVVILKSKDWPALSGSLETAAEKDGYIYRGPRQTSTAEQADTMVAEIEILRKPSK